MVGPQTFTFDRAVGSTEMTLTIPGIPLGAVVIDLVASGQVGTDLVALSSGHAEATLSTSSTSVSVQVLPVAPVVQTVPINDLDLLPATPSPPYIYGPAKTTFFKVAPTTPGLYRIVIVPGSTEDDTPVPVAFSQIYDSEGNIVAPLRVDDEVLRFWYIQITDVTKPYYVGLRAGIGSDNGVLFFDEATTAELTSLAPQTPEGEIDTTGTLVFTFPYAMDTGVEPVLTVLDANKSPVDPVPAVDTVWVSSTRLEIACTDASGWPSGELAFYLTGLKGQGASTTVIAGKFNSTQFLFWKRDSWQSLYIDPVAGNDANAGTADAPLKSLNRVFSSNQDSSRSLGDYFVEGTGRPVRIFMAASASASESLLLPGTTRMEHATNFGGIQLLGGRDPDNHWSRLPGAYSYLEFDGEFTVDYVIQTSFDIFLNSSANAFVMDGLFVSRTDQPNDYVTTANTSQTILVKISTAATGAPPITLHDNVFDAGALAFSKASVTNAMVIPLSVSGPNLNIYRNSIRNQPSMLTNATSSLGFVGLWLRNSALEDGRWLVANNTIESGGLSVDSGSSNGYAIGISSITNNPDVFITNNTIRVDPSRANQLNTTREGIVGEAVGGAAIDKFQTTNNVIIFPVGPQLFYQAYLRNSQSTMPSFTAISNNLFTTDDTDPFGVLSNSNKSSAGYYQNYYGGFSVFQTMAAMNTAPHSANLASPDLLTDGGFVHPGTDLTGGFATGGFSLQSWVSSDVLTGGRDLTTSSDFNTDEIAEILSKDRSGAPRTGNGTTGWTMGAYEKD